jgi:hypothetical protein
MLGMGPQAGDTPWHVALEEGHRDMCHFMVGSTTTTTIGHENQKHAPLNMLRNMVRS